MESIKKILVPVDFSDYSKHALRYAIDFAKHFKAEIILISVIEPMIYPADFSMGQVAIPATDQNLHERIEQELKELEEKEIGNQVNSKRIIKSGKPFYEINETARDENVDLIIISTHGHTGVEHLLFGSTAERVVRKAPCPVLTLREPIKGFRFEQ
jgi:nucleotide-binding universal stress UspA family protein